MTVNDCNSKHLAIQSRTTTKTPKSSPRNESSAKVYYLGDASPQRQRNDNGEILYGNAPVPLEDMISNEVSATCIQLVLDSRQASQVIYNKTESGEAAHWVELTLVPFENSDGEVTHFTAIERDISH